MNLDPQLRYRKRAEVASAHRDLVVSDRFLAAADAALLQTVMNLPDTTDPAEAAANWHRVAGAREFLRTFINLGEQPVVLPPKPKPGNLDHTV